MRSSDTDTDMDDKTVARTAGGIVIGAILILAFIRYSFEK